MRLATLTGMKTVLMYLILILVITRIDSLSAESRKLEDIRWKTGDVIAQSFQGEDGITLLYEVATGGPWGHVGLVIVEDGVPFVYHSTPSTIIHVQILNDGTRRELSRENPGIHRTPLNNFMAESAVDKAGRPKVTVLRPIEDLSEDQIEKLSSFAKKRRADGIPYNDCLVFDDNADQCSDFIYKAYRAAGIDLVQEKEKLSDLDVHSFDGVFKKLFEKLSKRKLTNQDEFISPFLIVHSPKFEVLYSTLPTNRILSGRELYDLWTETKPPSEAFSDFSDLFPRNKFTAALHGLPLAEDILKKLSTRENWCDQPFREYPKHLRAPADKH